MPLQYKVQSIGGNCPVQAEGTIDGKLFYFRARWNDWSVSVYPTDGDLLNPDWFYERPYDGADAAAGWMSENEALSFIGEALSYYAKEAIAR